MPVSKETAQKIALAYREVEVGEKLLADLNKAAAEHQAPDIRDAFGRRAQGLQIGVPNGDTSRRLFDVEWSLAVPIIEAHVTRQRAIIAAMSETARAEMAL